MIFQALSSSEVTVEDVLKEAEEELRFLGIESPRLESEIFLEYATGLNKFQLYIDRQKILSPSALRIFKDSVSKRKDGYPVQYITGVANFRDLLLEVNSHVLIPRPETELLVDIAIRKIKIRQSKRSQNDKLRILDVGTGSGAIIISLAKEFGGCHDYIATDVSPEAIEVAQRNADKYGVKKKIEFIATSLMDGVGLADIVVANLPYIPTCDMQDLPTDVKKEPALALDGGPCGLDLIKRMVIATSYKLNPGGSLLLELGIGQFDKVKNIMYSVGYTNIKAEYDLRQIERFIVGEKGV